MKENALTLHGKGQILEMLRLALIPAIAGTRAALDCMTNNGPQTVSSKLDVLKTEELETKEAAYEVYRL